MCTEHRIGKFSSNTARGVSRIAAAAVLLTLTLSAAGFAQESVRVLFRLNATDVSSATAVVTATPANNSGGGCSATTANVRHRQTETSRDSILLTFGTTSVLNERWRPNAPAMVKYSRGNVSVNLNTPQYRDAEVSLHSVNGKRVLHGNASASNGKFNISRSNLASGAYLLSIKGVDGGVFATRIAHVGGKFNINMTFGGAHSSLEKFASLESCGAWTLTVTEPRYEPYSQTINLSGAINGRIDLGNITLTATTTTPPPANDFRDTVNGVSFEMIYIPGGTFTIGCERGSGNCPPDTGPVSGVTVSNYFISRGEVTQRLYNAVMGISGGSATTSITSIDWYDAMAFACRLSELTGRNYRMQTEAEFEYAAKNHASRLDRMGAGEEWAYNSWSSTHSGGTDPVGPSSGEHTQKTRRDAPETAGASGGVTARLIRSIAGPGPALRLTLSANTAFPPGYVPPCNIRPPELGGEPVNSYRDMRWVTGSGRRWTTGAIAIGSFDLRVWDDGTARMGSTNGQWFTSNNFAFVFVPTSGAVRPFAYIFMDTTSASLISTNNFMSNGYTGRIVKENATNQDKPTISNLMSGEALARAQPNFETHYKMVDMVNIPQSARGKDSRLIDGTNEGWWQDNVGTGAGGTHRYRKDIDSDIFRFVVYEPTGNPVNLAFGDWFTVNNMFLRVTDNRTHAQGPYVTDYLYTIVEGGGMPGQGSSGPTLYHNSFQAYERGDFRMHVKTPNAQVTGHAREIDRNLSRSFYAPGGFVADGHSTFTPAPCPPGGCGN